MAVGDKLRVMISSTVKDLLPERQAAEEAINSFRLDRFQSEAMSSLPKPSREVCDEMARTCDLMLLILGRRYGWTIPDLGISVTEREFNVAREENPGKILVFEKKPEDREEEQNRFAEEVKDFTDGYFVARPFESTDELKDQIAEAMAKWISDNILNAQGTSVGAASPASTPVPDQPEHTIWIEDEVFFKNWDRIAWEIRMLPIDADQLSTITDVRAKLFPRGKRAYLPDQWTRSGLALPGKIGSGRDYEATTFEFQPPAKLRQHCPIPEANDPTGQFEMLAEIDYQTEGQEARTLQFAGVSVVRRHQAPAPIEVRWGGGTTNAWEELTRKLEVQLRADGPVEITEIEAWMMHRDAPETRYPGRHDRALPTTLGGDQQSLDETVLFLTKRLPEELQHGGTPKNLITLSARVRYVDREGNADEQSATDLAI